MTIHLYSLNLQNVFDVNRLDLRLKELCVHKTITMYAFIYTYKTSLYMFILRIYKYICNYTDNINILDYIIAYVCCQTFK